MARRKDAEAIVAFHLAALKQMLGFLRARGIHTREQLNGVDGTKLLDESLWKLTEAHGGKYGGPFISQGVKELEEATGCRVRASSGTWNEKDLVRAKGMPRAGGAWRSDPACSCHLEHVAERAEITRMLLAHPDKVAATLESVLLACVVLKTEHRQLPSLPIVVDDPWRRYRGRVRVWSRATKTYVVE